MYELSGAPNQTARVGADGVTRVAQVVADKRVADRHTVAEWIPQEVLDAQREDDVDGNGIFDDTPNLHLGEGIFEDNQSLPGYAARETGLGPSEVIDAQTGTPTANTFVGFWNRKPLSQFVGGTRWPIHSGPDVPNPLPTADDFDQLLGGGVPVQDDWNGRNVGMAQRGVGLDLPEPARTLANPHGKTKVPAFPDWNGRNVAIQRGPVSGLGAIDTASVGKWVLAGIVAGAVLAVVYENVK